MITHKTITRLALLCSALVAGCDEPEQIELTSASPRPLPPRELEQMAQDIADLADLEGPEIDDMRRSLPVPAIRIDLSEDGELAIPLAEATSPGLPQGAVDRGARMSPGQPDDAPLADVPTPLQPRTVFGAENRWNFFDTSYPFSTTGKLDTPKGGCTGTMVGPRHVMTASHCIQWNADGTTGWVRFRPMLYDSYAPYGEAWGTLTYSYRRVPGPTLSGEEVAFDFVVVVLDRTMGNSTGFMGSKTYTPAWNGSAVWANVGYPTSIGGGVRPAFQNACAVNDAINHCWSGWCSMRLLSQCDSSPGNSGGPLWGTWNEGPSVVSVISAENPQTNSFAGGSLLPTIIQHARTNSP